MLRERVLCVALAALMCVCCTGTGAGVSGDAINVLVVFPLPAPSHGILGAGVVTALLDAGHQVTYVTPFPIKTAHKNLSQVDIGTMDDIMSQHAKLMNLEKMLSGNAPQMNVNTMLGIIMLLTQRALQAPPFQQIINDTTQTFDLVIAEWMLSEMNAGLSIVFECPLIWVVPTEPHYLSTALVDEYLHPAYTVNMLSDYTTPLSFAQRVAELYTQVLTYVMKEFVFYSYESKMYEEVFGPIMEKRGGTLPALHEIKYNASLVLGNSHVSLGEAMRLPANYKPVGGYHIPARPPPLPQDLQKIMDDADHGVIYFSMGSNLKSKDLPDSMKRGFLKMFGDLKQTVVWKFEEELSELPGNVHVVKWAPQHSILAHPNCVLFITHGGMLSTTETIHFGKPIIGVPVFGDQHTNVMRATARGFAVHVPLSNSLVEDLAAAINKVLSDSKYAEKARELSVVYHDRVVPPAQELAHWARHVVRTRGAPRLRSPALAVPLYQKLYLDLAAVFLATLVLVGLVLKRILVVLFSKNKVSRQKKNE